MEEATISVLAVCVLLCSLSDNTYVHVHVCGAGGGAHMKWTWHMEAHDNWVELRLASNTLLLPMLSQNLHCVYAMYSVHVTQCTMSPTVATTEF